MTHSARIASLHLLESGNLEVTVASKNCIPATAESARFFILAAHWGNPEFQAMLDKAIAADIAGME